MAQLIRTPAGSGRGKKKDCRPFFFIRWNFFLFFHFPFCPGVVLLASIMSAEIARRAVLLSLHNTLSVLPSPLCAGFHWILLCNKVLFNVAIFAYGQLFWDYNCMIFHLSQLPIVSGCRIVDPFVSYLSTRREDCVLLIAFQLPFWTLIIFQKAQQ